MAIDIDDLRKKAEAAPNDAWYYAEALCEEDAARHGEAMEFALVATPAAVLELIAERDEAIDALRAGGLDLADMIPRLTQALAVAREALAHWNTADAKIALDLIDYVLKEGEKP